NRTRREPPPSPADWGSSRPSAPVPGGRSDGGTSGLRRPPKRSPGNRPPPGAGPRSPTGDRARRPLDSRPPPLASALLFRWRPAQSLFQPVDGKQHLTMNLHQAGATLAKAPVILGEAAPAGTVLGADRAEAGSAGLAPTQHGGRVGRPLG